MKRHIAAVIIAVVAILLLGLAAQAQEGCVVRIQANGVQLDGCNVLEPAATLTPVAPTPTNTPAVQPVDARVLNAPLYALSPGDPGLDSNGWSILWAGDVSPAGGYTQARLVGISEGVIVYVQQMRPGVSPGATFTLTLGSLVQSVHYESPGGWNVGSRCGADGYCRGWSAERTIPWAALGGKPVAGAVWPLRLEAPGGKWAGSLRWGLPNYAGRDVAGAKLLTLALSGDSMLGGGTDCGAQDWPDYFPTWGTRNWGSSPYANVQAQWDTADWPCYSKYYAAWSLASLPAGAQVVSATVEMRQFGNPGYGESYAEDGTKDTVMQVYEVREPWGEASITWDTAPVPAENTGRTLVKPLPSDCAPTPYWYCNPGIPYQFDVTEIVKRSQADGRGWASMALYTAAGQYHSGKYFWSKEGAEPPIVRISYVVESESPPPIPTTSATATSVLSPSATATATNAPATSSPSATWTSTPKPSATPLPTATATAPSPSATPRPMATATSSPTPTQKPSSTPPAPAGNTYYISPTGNDSAGGGSTTTAWKTFNRAWRTLQPGDTLLVMDGTYTESIQPNVRNGQAGQPITVRALNDGKVVIDGQGVRRAIQLGDTWGPNGGPIGDWYVVEGVVARNGSDTVVHIKGSNNVLRRVSAYNANPDLNSTVVLLWGDNNLVEDAVAAGTGRYMFEVYQGNGNTLRRIFAQWERWDGRQFCGVQWPHGYNVGVYNASDTTIENAIAYGRAPAVGILVQANGDGTVASNNAILGSMALMSGRDRDGSVWDYGAGQAQPTQRPLPSACPDNVTQWSWGGQRVGFALTGQGTMQNNVFRDVLAANNVGVGFVTGKPYAGGAVSGNLIERASLTGNGAGAEFWERAQGGQLYNGLGVQVVAGDPVLLARYVDRVLTTQPLLPWAMEGRIQKELGVSVSGIVREYAGEAQ